MRTHKFDNREEWFAARMGKITGSRLKDIVVKRGTGHKIGFYELIAEKVSTDPYGRAFDETPMERGTRLEPEAMQKFIEDTGLKADTTLVLWEREENSAIAVSPDGFMGDEVAVECKCLSSARHIEAYLTQQIPDEYYYQTLQYFIVNDLLTTLYVVFYDPRMTVKDYFFLKLERKDLQEEIAELLEYQRKTLLEVDEAVNKLTF